jgi:tRNA nucleotidyltransferase (CCA-adding enzyme)
MREDRLRALRAIRFASRFGFVIEPATLAAVRSSAPHLTRLSAERVQQELVKTMEQVARPAKALRLWRGTGALAVLVPSLANVADMTLDTLDFLPMATAGARKIPQRTSNRVAALFLDLPSGEVREALGALRFSKHETNWAAGMSDRWRALGLSLTASLAGGVPDEVQLRRWLAELGRLQAGPFLRIAAARWEAMRPTGAVVPEAAAVRALHRRMERSRFRDPLELGDLAIGGEDLRRAGIAPGPIYAKILNALLERVLDDPARNTPEALIAEIPRLAAEAGERAESRVHPSTEQ